MNFQTINAAAKADPAKFSGQAQGVAAGVGLIGGYLDRNKPTLGGGALKGGAQGAAMGASFGPIGVAVGAGLGAAAGVIGASAEQRKLREAREAALAAQQRNELTTLQAGDESTGTGYYRNGGLLRNALQVRGGQFRPLSERSVEVQGNSHEEGGVMVPGQNAEVEGGETISDNYVFSDRLGFAHSHKKLMKPLGAIEGKAPTKERLNSIKDIMQREHELKLKQELVKSLLPHGQQ